MRIRCFGYFDEELLATDKLVALMHMVESGEVERPEIELVDEQGEAETIVHIGALFGATSGECVGWLVSTRDTASHQNYAYCMNSVTPTPQCTSVLFCGSPETVGQSAILSVDQVADFVQELVDGKSKQLYSRKIFSEVFS